MTVRLTCCVPFCTHTRGARKGDKTKLTEGADWICAKHWMALPKSMRRVDSRIRRQLDRAIAADPLVRQWWNMPKGEARVQALLLWRRYDRIWAMCKKRATENGLGI